MVGAPLPRWPQITPSESCRDLHKRAEAIAAGSSESSAGATTAPIQETPVEEPPVMEPPVTEPPVTERRSKDINSIQELEEDKDWENGQFQDADLNHLQDSDHIRQEYSAHFIKESDQEQYYKQDTFQSPTPKTVYYLPELDYYNTSTRPKPGTKYQNPNIYLPPPRDPRDIEHWYGGKGRGCECRLQLHSHKLFGEKTCSLESRIARKKKKNLRQWEKHQSNQ